MRNSLRPGSVAAIPSVRSVLHVGSDRQAEIRLEWQEGVTSRVTDRGTFLHQKTPCEWHQCGQKPHQGVDGRRKPERGGSDGSIGFRDEPDFASCKLDRCTVGDRNWLLTLPALVNV